MQADRLLVSAIKNNATGVILDAPVQTYVAYTNRGEGCFNLYNF